MFKKIIKNKWLIHWLSFGLLIFIFVFTAVVFQRENWIGNVLQTVGTIAGIYLTIIIFLNSKEDSDKQYRKHLENLQKLNAKQIEVMQELTAKQIAALQKSTNDEISSFEKQITEVTNKLTDNSILLAEILGRELEKALGLYENAIKKEQKKYKNLSDWKLLRTIEERELQLNIQWDRIEYIKNGYNYLVDKYNQLKKFLRIDQKSLDE